MPVPRHHLEGFKRGNLKAGETKAVKFVSKPRRFACYDDNGIPFIEDGRFRISAGGGQPDDSASGSVSGEININ